MEIQLWQVIAITLFIVIAQYDGLNTGFGLAKPAVAGGIAGFILGDMQTGLFVGGTLNLMSLGVGNFGGAVIPDYTSGAVLGAAFAIMSGEGPEIGISLGIPVALLLTQLDILARFTNTFIQQKAYKYAQEGNYSGLEKMNLLGLLPWALSRAIPVSIGLLLGTTFVENVVNNMPQWLMGGLKTAGAIVPALGIAILLKYLSIKKYVAYLLIGFALAAYLSMPMLGISIVGLALALVTFERRKEGNVAVAYGGDDEDE
ncbi:PTS mannose/fructose/sorbose/N-acetylgalactosamine transporter subunit IIC [Clostridium baratii]|uniref:PTS mannose/fructose/sorbose/N-acetylgalactosamine transporter subunit IIC n=1 Tax=Clostridium baratii TaxID=1561 RepID=UPI00097FAAA2|nr:PTS sugar transporter subunit IIC [Clostridium baratii]AQM60562.1 PTS sorbose transporter subunit IIC [Clostridium baratii]MBS6042411.1 PTS sugar transporter subunit IIC [Clostridium baratii]